MDSSLQTPDPLAALRAATASRHELLDAGLPLAQAGASLDDYRDHLLMLRAWLLPIEAWLAGFDDGPQAAQAPPPLARSGLIDADLALLPSRSISAPACAAWPPDAGAASRWGVCYVVEGAQLGAAVLYRRLAGPLSPHRLAYLQGSAEGPGARWHAFAEALRADVRGAEQVAEACAGACDAFDRILALRGVFCRTPAAVL